MDRLVVGIEKHGKTYFYIRFPQKSSDSPFKKHKQILLTFI